MLSRAEGHSPIRVMPLTKAAPKKLRYEKREQRTKSGRSRGAHLLRVTGGVADGVEDACERPGAADTGSDVRVLQANEESGGDHLGQPLERVLVCAWMHVLISQCCGFMAGKTRTLGAVEDQGLLRRSSLSLLRIHCTCCPPLVTNPPEMETRRTLRVVNLGSLPRPPDLDRLERRQPEGRHDCSRSVLISAHTHASAPPPSARPWPSYAPVGESDGHVARFES